jgi:phosphotransferase system enzyme I (PtsI)
VIVERRIAPREVAHEVRRLKAAIAATDQQLALVGGELEAERRHDAQAIVEVHRMMLKSAELFEGAHDLIRSERLAAEPAVRRVIDRLRGRFEELEDPYFRDRGEDLEAIGDRLLRVLLHLPAPDAADGPSSGAIGVGALLSAIDAFQLHRAGLAGLVTERGGKTSHAAIVMRGLEIPYVFGAGDLFEAVTPGDLVIVDGEHGAVIVGPDGGTLAEFQARQNQQLARARRLRARGTAPAVTSDGVAVDLGANVANIAEIARAAELGAASIGLLRTEFLYLERPDLPTEDEQYEDAVAALEAAAGRVLTFRTLDLGGEKLPLAVKIPSGPNPSLGVRSIRFSFRRPDIFRAQLRALYRASAHGPLRIMFPLVATVAELVEAQAMCAEVRRELAGEGLPFDARVPIGAMIETPSAALTVDHLAEACDFFSVGTNDLIQYLFAADRDNEDVAYLYHPLHPAVLRLLKQAVDAAARCERPLALCGDMAGDPGFTWILLGLGVRALSMSPRHLPAVRSVIAGTCLGDARALTEEALALRSDHAVEALVAEVMRRRFPLELAAPEGAPEGALTAPRAAPPEAPALHAH